MIALYVAYVVLAIAAHWIERRGQENLHRESLYRNQFLASEGGTSDLTGHARADDILIDVEDNSTGAVASTPTPAGPLAESISSAQQAFEPSLHHLGHYAQLLRSPGPTQELSVMVRPSLVGAIEFRALASSLRGSRRQSSASSSTLNQAHLSRFDAGGSVSGCPGSLPVQRQPGPPLRVSSVDRLHATSTVAKNHEPRKRAHSANNAVSESASPAQRHIFNSNEPLSMGSNAPLISTDQGVPAIILTNHESGPFPPLDVDHGRNVHRKIITADSDDFLRKQTTSHGRPSENAFSNSPAKSSGGSQHGSEILQQRQLSHPPGPLSDGDGQSNDPERELVSSSQTMAPYRDDPEPSHFSPTDQALSRPESFNDAASDRIGLTSRSRSSYRPRSYLPSSWAFCATMFPTFFYWRRKSGVEKALALFTAPAVFLLTLTLPVVDTDEATETRSQQLFIGSCDAVAAGSSVAISEDEPVFENAPGGRSVRLSRHTSGSIRSIENLENQTIAAAKGLPRCSCSRNADGRCNSREMMRSAQREPVWRYWLSAVHIFTAPSFVAFIIWLNVSNSSSIWGLSAWVGCTVAICVVFFAILLIGFRTSRDRLCRDFLCLLGFVVSVAWISTIAGEVIGILKAFGVIFGLSEALLGLTVFALGNRYGVLFNRLSRALTTASQLWGSCCQCHDCKAGPSRNGVKRLFWRTAFKHVHGRRFRRALRHTSWSQPRTLGHRP